MAITVDATYEGGVLKPEHPLPLHEHQKVRVTVEQQSVSATDTSDRLPAGSSEPSIGEQIAAMAAALPPGALDNLPDDLASEVDHYLYGTSKRSK